MKTVDFVSALLIAAVAGLTVWAIGENQRYAREHQAQVAPSHPDASPPFCPDIVELRGCTSRVERLVDGKLVITCAATLRECPACPVLANGGGR